MTAVYICFIYCLIIKNFELEMAKGCSSLGDDILERVSRSAFQHCFTVSIQGCLSGQTFVLHNTLIFIIYNLNAEIVSVSGLLTYAVLDFVTSMNEPFGT